jgi:hypothetical protein
MAVTGRTFKFDLSERLKHHVLYLFHRRQEESSLRRFFSANLLATGPDSIACLKITDQEVALFRVQAAPNLGMNFRRCYWQRR